MSKGISVMLESSTSRPVTRKRVDPWLRKNYTTQEVASMRQLASHPNIVQLIEYMPANPWSGHGRAVPRALRGFPGPRYPATHATRAARVLRGAACCGTRGVRVAPRLGLLSAVALMHFGVRSADEQSAGNWASIYHRDLHSANVFLSAKGPKKDRGYPRIVVGSFGCSKAEEVIDAARVERADLENDSINDVKNVANLVHGFCYQSAPGTRMLTELGCPEEWVYGEELRGIAVRLSLKDDVQNVLTLLDAVGNRKQELVAAGQLKFCRLLTRCLELSSVSLMQQSKIHLDQEDFYMSDLM